MATRFTDVLHETMVALGCDINWFTSKWAVCGSGQVNESGLRRVLRVLGERSLCPGVGEGGVSPAARPGYSAVARGAVRNGAAEKIARPASSFVIGARTGDMI